MLQSRRTGLLALLAALSIGLTGCTFVIRPNPNPMFSMQKINLNVGLLIDDAVEYERSSTSGLCMVGMVHTWTVETGQALRDAATTTFRKMFSEVTHLRTGGEFASSDLVLLIKPAVDRFKVEQSLSAQLDLHCILSDRTGRVLYDEVIPASGGGSGQAAACLFGVFAGENAIRESSTKAFNSAFEQLAEDISRKVDFSPYLRR